ncbi:helix-turn-helix transcriptional regulator [Pararhizobium sp. BT-229]|nr:helix-turn-helix transcriptional regulator [Pararhizobium sp. BT-229]
MARVALDWSVMHLAEKAHVSTNTIVRLERGDELKTRTIDDIRKTFEGAGVLFFDGEYSGSGGPSVRLAHNEPRFGCATSCWRR